MLGSLVDSGPSSHGKDRLASRLSLHIGPPELLTAAERCGDLAVTESSFLADLTALIPALMLEMDPSQGPKGSPFIRCIPPLDPLQRLRLWKFPGF